MSIFPPQFQIHSDLHLETPLTTHAYAYFSSQTNFLLHASNLFLLGDIGLVRDYQLFDFLRSLLKRTPNLKIFYVLGNHEAYGIMLEGAKSQLREFEEESKREFGSRFVFMDQRRHDINGDLTLLGCTLWSRITESQRIACESRLTDFHPDMGIRNRTVDTHNSGHVSDLTWLNAQVKSIEQFESHRSIIVLTHHSPTMDKRANDPRHDSQPKENDMQTGFVTDLREEICWRSRNVKVWSFGHTHYSCAFYADDDTSKPVVGNQKGYAGVGGIGNWNVKTVVIEADEGGTWRVVDDKDEKETTAKRDSKELKCDTKSRKESKKSAIVRAMEKVNEKFRLRHH
jgi:hypothetical protein